MPILHMQTENTRQTAKLLTSTGMQCSDVSSQLHSAWVNLRGDWWGDSAEMFTYEIEPLLNTLNQLAEQIETLGLRVEREVAEWEQVDNNGATNLQGITIPTIEEMAAIAAISSGGVGAAYTMGQVLGASATTGPQTEWARQYEEYQALLTREQEIRDELARLNPENMTLEELNARIDALEAERAELVKEKDRLFNKFWPNGMPPNPNDGDGFPLWRTETDDYEDQIAGIDNELADLKAARDKAAELDRLQQLQDSLYSQVKPAEYPVDQEGRISSPFGERDGKIHIGTDIISRESGDREAGIQPLGPGRIVHIGEDGPGNQIQVEHTLVRINQDTGRLETETIVAQYLHMDILPDLKAGDVVTPDTWLGEMGDSGIAHGDHLHLAVFKDAGNIGQAYVLAGQNNQQVYEYVYNPEHVMNGELGSFAPY